VNQEIFSLRKENASELRSVLVTGKVFRYGENRIALPREVVLGHGGGVDSVVFEAIRYSDLSRPTFWRVWWQAIRPENFLLTLLPSLSILIYGLVNGWSANTGMGLLALLGVFCLQIAIIALNDVEDYLRLVDFPNILSGTRVLQKGWLSVSDLRKMAIISLVLGIALGLPVAWQSPAVLVPVGIVTLLGVLSFSNRPFGMKYRALGEFVLFWLIGPLLALGISEAIFQRRDVGILLLGAAYGNLACVISHLKNMRDIEVDRSRGVVTLATLKGFKRSRLDVLFFSGAAVVLALGSMVFGASYGTIVRPIILSLGLLGGLLLLTCWPLFKAVYKASGPYSALFYAIERKAFLNYLAFGIFLSLGYLASSFLH